jgi:hypothetical protein
MKVIIMETKRIIVFDDRAPYTDNKAFVDYPKVKLRGYGSSGDGISRKLLVCIYLLGLASGIVFLVI